MTASVEIRSAVSINFGIYGIRTILELQLFVEFLRTSEFPLKDQEAIKDFSPRIILQSGISPPPS